MRRLLITALTMSMVALWMLPGTALGGTGKVDVCHLVGNGSYRSINVAESAIATHLEHGDMLVGGGVTGDCEILPVPDVLLDGYFVDSVGHTIANASGLTYHVGGAVSTDPDAVYVQKYWGDYPLYLPGERAHAIATVENAGDTATDSLMLVTRWFGLNLDGSLRDIGAMARFQGLVVQAESTVSVPVTGMVDLEAKGLYVIELELYLGNPSDGLLISRVELVFCPPELN